MAEESLAFYVLVITVMVAAGYDSLTGGRDLAASGAGSACWDRRSIPSRPVSRRDSPGPGIDQGLIGGS
jgi:hypothetical protein